MDGILPLSFDKRHMTQNSLSLVIPFILKNRQNESVVLEFKITAIFECESCRRHKRDTNKIPFIDQDGCIPSCIHFLIIYWAVLRFSFLYLRYTTVKSNIYVWFMYIMDVRMFVCAYFTLATSPIWVMPKHVLGQCLFIKFSFPVDHQILVLLKYLSVQYISFHFCFIT